jgi:hypothetical protein
MALGLVDRERKQPIAVFHGENPQENGDPAHVEPAVGEHLQEDRMPSRRPGHANSPEGLALGEMQDTSGVHEHRRAGVAGIETPEVHLGNVGDERGLVAADFANDVGERGEELVVGK